MDDAPKHAQPPLAPWRMRLHEVIFEADTPAGKFFDIGLLIAILISVAAVMLETVASVSESYARTLLALEYGFTALFTVEYVLRLACVRRPWKYALSFFGIVDLLAVLPTYLELVFLTGDLRSLLVIRALRLIRVFRILKLGHFLTEARVFRQAFLQSRAKIAVFLTAVLIVVVIMGTAIYMVEGDPKGSFSSIPKSCYWAIVTMTTVGYGDITPATTPGQLLAAVIMILGYSFIIVPVGIVSAELATASRTPISTQACPTCSAEGHDTDARYCKYCGGQL